MSTTTIQPIPSVTYTPLFENSLVEGRFGKYWANDSGQKAQQWIDTDSEGAIITMCTNPMCSRGTVYICKVVAGECIALASNSWWSMSYTKMKPLKAPKNFGKLVPFWLNGVGHSVAVMNGNNPIVQYGRG